jgi:hypothetical protein
VIPAARDARIQRLPLVQGRRRQPTVTRLARRPPRRGDPSVGAFGEPDVGSSPGGRGLAASAGPSSSRSRRGRDRLAVRFGTIGGDGGDVMASKDNLHRETLRAALRVIQTAETLEQARIQLGRMLNVFDKLEAQGLRGDAAVAEAEKRLTVTRAPKASAADERPVRRRESGL